MASPPLALYARVLRAHRTLPRAMRIVGDAYVKEEFRKHRTATPAFLPAFFAEWNAYAAQLEAQKGAGHRRVGAHLSPDLIAALTPDQFKQLQQLQGAARTSVASAAIAAAGERVA